MNEDPPQIPGVRRSFVVARGIRFHVTEAGEGSPVLALHGWPQHHFVYRDLLADPPEGMRIIAPDLPGYGWSGAPPHRWFKEEVASDVLALLDELGLERVLMVGHDWGGFVGYRLVLRAPERFSAYLVLCMPHPWNGPGALARHFWRALTYQPLLAAVGEPLQSRTPFIERVILGNDPGTRDPDVARIYADRFRDPVVARAATDTYRTLWLRELPASVREPESRRATVPIRAVCGAKDFAVPPALASPESAKADDFELEVVPDGGHFLLDQHPGLVRERLIELAKHAPAVP